MLTQILFTTTLQAWLFSAMVLINNKTERSIFNFPQAQVAYVQLTDTADIVPITDTLVNAVLYKGVISLEELSGNERRKKFIEMMLPSILLAKHKIEQDRLQANIIFVKAATSGRMLYRDFRFVTALFHKFKANNINELNKKMQTHPTSIVLAQAALESGWGSSRFYREAYNPFGMWSVNPNEPRIRSYRKMPNNYIIHLRKYETLGQSIVDYFGTIARVRAYRKFREANLNGKSTMELIPLLDKYSELGDYYCNQVITIIDHFDLLKYDNYQLNPYFLQLNQGIERM